MLRAILADEKDITYLTEQIIGIKEFLSKKYNLTHGILVKTKYDSDRKPIIFSSKEKYEQYIEATYDKENELFYHGYFGGIYKDNLTIEPIIIELDIRSKKYYIDPVIPEQLTTFNQ